MLSYTLAGAVNANTLPAGATAGHPGSTIELTEFPTAINTRPPQDTYNLRKTVNVPGLHALLTYPSTGFGVYRLDWNTGGRSYILSVSRLKTSDGTSGIPEAGLVKMAASIPTD